MEYRDLYKAKRVDDGEWVTGQYVKGLDMYDKEVHLIFEPTTIFYSSGETDGWSEIDQSTICRCIGSTDKNNNLIFENDIMKNKHNSYRVVWDNNEGSWLLAFDSVPLYGLGGANSKEYEVIGNIFDNPELLNKREKTYCKDESDLER